MMGAAITTKEQLLYSFHLDAARSPSSQDCCGLDLSWVNTGRSRPDSRGTATALEAHAANSDRRSKTAYLAFRLCASEVVDRRSATNNVMLHAALGQIMRGVVRRLIGHRPSTIVALTTARRE
jgi:hypothetical protein